MGKRFAIVIGVAAAGVMALGAQTATSTTGPVDSVPPDLRVSVDKKQTVNLVPGYCGDRGACGVELKVSCYDEACTVRAEGKLTKVKNDKLKPITTGILEPGEKPRRLVVRLTNKTRIQADEALAEGEKVKAKVTVRAKDAAGNVATAKRTIKIKRGSWP